MKLNFPNIFKKKATTALPDIPVKVPAPPKGVYEEDTTINKMKKVNIKALEGTNMKPGKVYSVSQQSADFLTKNGRAVLAKDSEKVGKVYNYPKTDKTPDPLD